MPTDKRISQEYNGSTFVDSDSGYRHFRATNPANPAESAPIHKLTGEAAMEEMGREDMIAMGMSEDRFISLWPLHAWSRKLKRERRESLE